MRLSNGPPPRSLLPDNTGRLSLYEPVSRSSTSPSRALSALLPDPESTRYNARSPRRDPAASSSTWDTEQYPPIPRVDGGESAERTRTRDGLGRDNPPLVSPTGMSSLLSDAPEDGYESATSSSTLDSGHRSGKRHGRDDYASPVPPSRSRRVHPIALVPAFVVGVLVAASGMWGTQRSSLPKSAFVLDSYSVGPTNDVRGSLPVLLTWLILFSLALHRIDYEFPRSIRTIPCIHRVIFSCTPRLSTLRLLPLHSPLPRHT